MLDRSDRRQDPAAWSASSTAGMVASAHYLATAAGIEMLEAGGDAVDAAAAVSLALGVAEPAGSGLGGMGVAVVHRHQAELTQVYAGFPMSPKTAAPEVVADELRYHGYRAVAVPTLPAVLASLLTRFSRLPLPRIVEPAARLASDGFPVTPHLNALSKRYGAKLRKFPGGGLFLDARGHPLEVGHLLRQPALADTLRRLGESGMNDFYEGRIAQEISRDMRSHGGFISASDLAGLPPVEPVPPLVGRFGSLDVMTLPEPGGGATLLQMLHMLDESGLDGFDPDSPEGAVLMARIVRTSRMDRIAHRMERSDAIRSDREYARAALGKILEDSGAPGETTHFCVMDGHGNAVSMTQSIERSFGAMVSNHRLGFLYNGYLRAFKVRNPAHPHFLRPGARARSNAAATIAIGPGREMIAIGSTGSERCASGVFQALVRLRAGASPFAAVAGPRLHTTPRGSVFFEAGRWRHGVEPAWRAAGLVPKPWPAYAFKSGGLQMAVRRGGRCTGVADPRRDGSACGPPAEGA